MYLKKEMEREIDAARAQFCHPERKRSGVEGSTHLQISMQLPAPLAQDAFFNIQLPRSLDALRLLGMTGGANLVERGNAESGNLPPFPCFDNFYFKDGFR